MALVGYASVSSVGQNLDVQLRKTKKLQKIFQRKKAERINIDKRAQLAACLEYVREEDTPFVIRFDRLARSTLQSMPDCRRVEKKERRICRCIDQNINTGDATGRLLFNMLGAIAQFETEIRARASN